MRRYLSCILLLLAACGDATPVLDDLGLVLVAQGGEGEVDQRIAEAQAGVRSGRNVVEDLERLGRAFVAKARATQDPGFYKLAEACADGIERRQGGHPGGRLLRGHVLHSLHRFAAAETVARALVAERGDFADHGLLGDVLYDKGDPAAALQSYQRMLDQKPCLQSYARAAQVRWLCGDLDGARELLRLAVGAGSLRDREALGWALARLASVELQAGHLDAAAALCARGAEIDADHVLLALVRARLLMAQGDVAGAAASAARAAERCPLPEHRWLAADLAREKGDLAGATAIEAGLEVTGAADDPRHFALWLLARGRDPGVALRLAEQELADRGDVFTHDLHAWALFASQRLDAAAAAMTRALALDTGDARLEYHAGAIAAARGDRVVARAHFGRAQAAAATLCPSERADLIRRAAAL